MKGFADEITWTAILWIFVALAVLIMVLIFILFSVVGSRPLSYTAKFIEISNAPFFGASILQHIRVEDRQILEHSTEAMVTGFVGKSDSDSAPAEIKTIFDKYGFDYYRIELRDADNSRCCGANKIFDVNNVPGYCNIDSYCVGLTTNVEDCGVGRIEVNPSTPCPAQGMMCCKYTDEESYKKDRISQGYHYYKQNSPGHAYYDVVRCGDYNVGVCAKGGCSEGTKITKDDGTCASVNNAETPFCCVEFSRNTELASSAEVPLIFKNKIGYLVVTIGR